MRLVRYATFALPFLLACGGSSTKSEAPQAPAVQPMSVEEARAATWGFLTAEHSAAVASKMPGFMGVSVAVTMDHIASMRSKFGSIRTIPRIGRTINLRTVGNPVNTGLSDSMIGRAAGPICSRRLAHAGWLRSTIADALAPARCAASSTATTARLCDGGTARGSPRSR